MKKSMTGQRILSVLLVALLLLTLIGCGKGGGASKEDFSKDFVKTWNAVEITSGDSDSAVSRDLMKEMNGLGMYMTLELKGDGSFIMDMMGDKEEGKWEAKSATEAKLHDTESGDSVDLKLEGSTLTMDLDGDRVIFEEFTGEKPTEAAEESEEEQEAEADTAEAGAAAAFTGDMGRFNYLDKLFVDYPADTFFQDESAILDTIKAKDESVAIGIVPQISEQDHEQSMEYFDSYAEYEDYTTEDTTIAGYEARIISYRDDWGDYNAEVHVYFGGEINHLYGVNFAITADHSMKDGLDPVVLEILNTIQVVE